ncbi:T9SS type A sorting domain-containing protein [Flavobacteriales bacterium]|nr:T9SS type A sorting domain-containing protein [Flavobacteriales bacterium]
MKKITLIFAGIISVFNLNAQVSDTVAIGAENDVYYSLENDEVRTVERENWDIAFNLGGYGSAILARGASNVELYVYENGDTSGWANFDTTGLSGWEPRNNSTETWSEGAFNRRGSSYSGWGNYSTTTHFVTADSLFLIKTSEGSYKKLWIDRLASSVYYFKYADLNGSNEVSETITKTDFTNKNYAYYSIDSQTELDREPANDSWDLLFSKYTAMLSYGGAQIPYGVTGVLSNGGVEVNKVSGIHKLEADTSDGSFSSSISTIGWDWKTHEGMGVYSTNDSLTHFVKSKSGNVWKVNFTGYKGGSNGEFHFSKERILSVGTMQSIDVLEVSTFPNPATDFLNIVLHQKDNENLNLTVFNMSGSLVYSELFTGTSGVNNLQLSVGEYSKGLYLVNVESQKASVQTKFIVK